MALHQRREETKWSHTHGHTLSLHHHFHHLQYRAGNEDRRHIHVLSLPHSLVHCRGQSVVERGLGTRPLDPHDQLASTNRDISVDPHDQLASTNRDISVDPHDQLASTNRDISVDPHDQLASTNRDVSVDPHDQLASTTYRSKLCNS